MSDMPRVIHANEKLTSVVDMRIVADVMNPTVSAQYTSYKRTDTVVDKTLVGELITAVEAMSSLGCSQSKAVDEAIAAIRQGEGK